MGNIKLILLSTTIIIGITGAVLAKTHEKKRVYQTTAYFRDGNNSFWRCLVLCSALLRSQGSSTQATITDSNGTPVPLYLSQSTSDPAALDN